MLEPAVACYRRPAAPDSSGSARLYWNWRRRLVGTPFGKGDTDLLHLLHEVLDLGSLRKNISPVQFNRLRQNGGQSSAQVQP
jgi:hypothetical protein